MEPYLIILTGYVGPNNKAVLYNNFLAILTVTTTDNDYNGLFLKQRRVRYIDSLLLLFSKSLNKNIKDCTRILDRRLVTTASL